MTSVLAYHVTMRLEGGRVLCRQPSARREAAQALFEQGDPRGLVAFRVADTHIHALLACSRHEAGRFAQLASTSLRWRIAAPVAFEPARFAPVADQSHLTNAFRYVLRQERRHGTAMDPFHDGSSLPDLLGARRWLRGPAADTTLGEATARRVASLLPRIRRRELLAELGLHEDPTPALGSLLEAAAAAFGLDHARGRGALRSLARRAAVFACAGLVPTARIAELLGVSSRAVQQLRAAPVPLCEHRAVVLQLQMRAAHLAQPLLEAPLAPVEE